MTVDDVIKEAEDTATGNSNYTYTNSELDNKVVITNDSGVVDYSLIDMTVVGGKVPNKNEYYSGLLVATNDRGLIDYSFIDKTQTTKANTLVQTNSSGVINLNLLPASTSPKANSIPISTAGGSGASTIDNGWINSTVSDATPARFVLTSSTGLIDNNLLKKSSSSAANTLVVGDSNGKINDNWLVTTNDGKDNPNGLLKLNNGKIGIDVIPDDKYVPISGGITDGNILINGPSPNTNTHKAVSNGKTVYTGLTNLKGALPNFVGIGGNSYQDGFLVGMNGSSNTNNYLMIATYDEGNEPIYVRQYTGNPGYSGLTQSKSITLMDASGNTALNTLTVTNNITSTNGALSVKSNITSTNGNLKISGTGTNNIIGNTTIGNSANNSTLSVQGKITANNGIDVLNGGVISIVVETASNATFNGVPKTHIQGGLGGASDNWRIAGGATGSDSGFLEIATDDNGDEPIYIRQYKTHPWQTLVRTATILDNLGNTSFPGNLSVGGTITSTGLLTANGGINIPITGDKVVNSSTDANAPLIIGSKTGLHVSFDENEISARSNGSGGSSPLYINPDGGEVSVGHNQRTTNNAPFIVYGKITANNGLTVNNAGASFTGGDISLTNGKISITTGNTVTSGITEHIHGQMAANDDWRIASGATASNSGYVELATADDGSEPIYIRQYTGANGNHFGTIKRTLTLLDASGNTELPGTLKVKGTGDSSFAGKLTTGSLGTGAITSTGITNSGALSNTGNVTIGGTLGVTGATTLSNTLTVSKATTISGLLTANGGVVIPTSGDKISTSSDTSAPFIIGTTSGIHLSFDQDEISARSNSTGGKRALYLQPDGGDVILGEHAASSLNIKNSGNLSVSGTSTFTGDATANHDFTINHRLRMKALSASEFGTLVSGWGSSGYNEPIKVIAQSAGSVVSIGGAGNTIIAGGESQYELYDYTYNTNINGANSDGHYGTNTTAFNNNGDSLYLIADQHIYFQDHAQTNYARAVSNTIDIYDGSITAPNTITATNFEGKWSGYTEDIGTKPSIADATWILLNNNAKIQHTTIGDIKSLVADSATKSANGHTKLPSGVMIQWGKQLVSNDTNSTVNFNSPYFSTVYSIVISMQNKSGQGAGGSYTHDVVNSSVTTTGFSVKAYIEGGGDKIYINWIAVGV